MSTHSPLPVGAIKTKVLILLIVLIIAGVAGTVIFTHLLKAERKPETATTTLPAQPVNLPSVVTSAANTTETAHYGVTTITKCTPALLFLGDALGSRLQFLWSN